MIIIISVIIIVIAITQTDTGLMQQFPELLKARAVINMIIIISIISISNTSSSTSTSTSSSSSSSSSTRTRASTSTSTSTSSVLIIIITIILSRPASLSTRWMAILPTGSLSTASIWGFDYHYTNYKFKHNIECQTTALDFTPLARYVLKRRGCVF